MLGLDRVEVTQPGGHRSLHRSGNDLPDLFAVCRHRPDQRSIASDKRRTIPGHVALLTQRIQHQYAFGGPATHIGAQGARRGGKRIRIRFRNVVFPLHQRIAFIGQHHGTNRARGTHNTGHLFRGQHLTGRIARRIDPNGLDARHILPGIRIRHVVDLQRLRAGQLRADLVRRIRHLRLHDDIALAEMQQRRHQRDAFLGTDRRHRIGADRTQIDIAGGREPLVNGVTQIGGTCRNGISVRVRVVRRDRERLTHRIGNGVDGRTDGQVDHATERGFRRTFVRRDAGPVVRR